MHDLEKARSLLERENYTCVICHGEDVITDRRRGVRPLLELLESGKDLHGYSAADRVVGKAAAFLYCLLGVNDERKSKRMGGRARLRRRLGRYIGGAFFYATNFGALFMLFHFGRYGIYGARGVHFG